MQKYLVFLGIVICNTILLKYDNDDDDDNRLGKRNSMWSDE